ncbi:MAG: hypothetical protein QM726_17575 [Chitinophagaceae bacterium]
MNQAVVLWASSLRRISFIGKSLGNIGILSSFSTFPLAGCE